MKKAIDINTVNECCKVLRKRSAKAKKEFEKTDDVDEMHIMYLFKSAADHLETYFKINCNDGTKV